jgi:hypothetical protein
MFGIAFRKEPKVLKALASTTTVEAIQRSLSECTVDGTLLSGTSSERLEMEQGWESTRFVKTLSRVFRDIKGGSIGGVRQTVDDGFQKILGYRCEA